MNDTLFATITEPARDHRDDGVPMRGVLIGIVLSAIFEAGVVVGALLTAGVFS